MHLRTRILSVACAACTAALVAAAPALAESSLTVQVPANPKLNTNVDVTYSGFAGAPGTAPLDGVGPNMMLRVYYELNARNCQATSSAQLARRGSVREGALYVESPAPFTFTSTLQFATAGAYRFCTYLEAGQMGQDAAPEVFAEAVLQIGAPPRPCSVPRITGFTLTTATKKLKAAACTLGTVKKPRKWKGKTLIVSAQSQPAQRRLANAAKVNVVLKVKPKTKKSTKKK